MCFLRNTSKGGGVRKSDRELRLNTSQFSLIILLLRTVMGKSLRLLFCKAAWAESDYCLVLMLQNRYASSSAHC